MKKVLKAKVFPNSSKFEKWQEEHMDKIKIKKVEIMSVRQNSVYPEAFAVSVLYLDL